MSKGVCVFVNDQEWGCFSIFWRADDVTSRGQCPRGGGCLLLVNVQGWGCFSIFWRVDDVTRTKSKGGGSCECLHPPPFRKSCIRACVPPIQVQTPPHPTPTWMDGYGPGCYYIRVYKLATLFLNGTFLCVDFAYFTMGYLPFHHYR